MPFDRRERVIGASVAEFVRGLELAFPGGVARQDGRLRIEAFDAVLEIEIEALAPLAIGMLRMPRLRARFAFARGAPEDQDRLFEHLDRATQRGGG
ncbi:MAG TPA: hypothetical protein VMG60_03145 [Burkholderiaceae bacterium]|nr:hypothetical protein [Burkholderiaceae bacterium]